jgi:hypothetical protein
MEGKRGGRDPVEGVPFRAVDLPPVRPDRAVAPPFLLREVDFPLLLRALLPPLVRALLPPLLLLLLPPLLLEPPRLPLPLPLPFFLSSYALRQSPALAA